VGGLQQLTRRFLNEAEPDHFFRFAAFWPALKRAAIRSVSLPDTLRQWLATSLTLSNTVTPGNQTGAHVLEAGWQAAHSWGYKRIFLLLDGAGERQDNRPQMLARLQPLLERQTAWQDAKIFTKYFLPTSLKPNIVPYMKRLPTDLPNKPFEVIIKWDESSLRALLQKRFEVATRDVRHLGFDVFAGPGLEGKLDNWLLTKAQGSPQRLLKLTNALVDAYVGRQEHTPLITQEDCQKALRTLGEGSPPS
jgi:hypothetical protein